MREFYDYIIIDCMPSLGMMTINALACADSVLIPVQAAYLPVKGLQQLIKTIGRVKKQLNPKLKIEGILLTMNQYKKAPTSEIAAEAGISKSLLFHYFHNKLELYLFLWKYAADLTKKYMCKYKVYETDDFFGIMM